jgi:co-chaperonin GroES (HSP10)
MGVSPGKYDFVVKEVGPEVESVEPGQKVIFNEYDMKGLQTDDETMFALVQEQNVMATYE